MCPFAGAMAHTNEGQNELLSAVQALRAERDRLKDTVAEAKQHEQEYLADAAARASEVGTFESRITTLQYANEALQQSVDDLRGQMGTVASRSPC